LSNRSRNRQKTADLNTRGQEISQGSQAYQETLSSEPASKNTRLSNLVNRVGDRIAAVSRRNNYQWEFRLISSPTQNAFCLPGGKVAICEGILPDCEDEAGAAVVMSHEIAHALVRHGGQRMNQNLAIDGAKQVAENWLEIMPPTCSKS
jgi:predicted Zn-dependent protease